MRGLSSLLLLQKAELGSRAIPHRYLGNPGDDVEIKVGEPTAEGRFSSILQSRLLRYARALLVPIRGRRRDCESKLFEVPRVLCT